MHQKRAVRVFICHAQEDKAVARDLYARLSKDGFSPWLDEENLLPGQDWHQEIRKAVRGSDAVIVCLSSRSVSKEGYIQRELKYVREIAEEKPAGTIFVIPVKLDDCGYPDDLRSLQWVSLTDMSNYPKVLRALGERAAQLGCSPEQASPIHAMPRTSGLAEKLEALHKSRMPFRVAPIFPSGRRDDEFTVGGIEGETVLFEKSSTGQRIYVPLIRVVEILKIEPREPALLNLNGRMQWLSPNRTWRFFPAAPANRQEEQFGIAKPYSEPDVQRLAAVLRGKNQEVSLIQEDNVGARITSGWQIVYDEDGCYVRRKDCPCDSILMTDGF